ncbi:hypothetical protein F511_18689 [Dorcoceras hygrometricum]|uniref:Uncharacterized protein n=1 Tax=Dorcoceras hygrometricum TaxID=472368 RepID=A0A2Z7AJJ8_9LAMI|nr:hypothetical protein F511_18689 [Dorcoceras hygrometricum]
MESPVMTSALMSSQSAVGNQQMKKAAGALSVDDISSDVITQQEATVISRKLSADEKSSAKDEATSCWRISRWFSVDDVIGDVIIFSRWFERAVARSSSRKLQWIQLQRKDFQTQCLCTQMQEDKSSVVEEDSGEAIDKRKQQQHPVASYSIQSQEIQAQRIVEVAKRSS